MYRYVYRPSPHRTSILKAHLLAFKTLPCDRRQTDPPSLPLKLTGLCILFLFMFDVSSLFAVIATTTTTTTAATTTRTTTTTTNTTAASATMTTTTTTTTTAVRLMQS